mgnify:CR=1 FL=1
MAAAGIRITRIGHCRDGDPQAVLRDATGGRWLVGSYHPSQQNTVTGRLTESMLDEVFVGARELISTK